MTLNDRTPFVIGLAAAGISGSIVRGLITAAMSWF
jgi:hypothetical protein